MMAEVVRRRFTRLQDEKRTLPDLVVVDGGKGQLSAAGKALADLGVNQQSLVGLAKRLDEVFLPDRPDAIMISKSSPALRLLQRIRDEAHRFAIAYHRHLRGHRVRGSDLEALSGIGRERARRLLHHFGSLKRLAAASLDDLIDVPGLGPVLARRVHQYLREIEGTP
jgi:excinuclease ABC subunit C